MPWPAAGENFGGLVVVKLLRDNLVELNLIQLERYNIFRKSSFQPKLLCLKTFNIGFLNYSSLVVSFCAPNSIKPTYISSPLNSPPQAKILRIRLISIDSSGNLRIELLLRP